MTSQRVAPANIARCDRNTVFCSLVPVVWLLCALPVHDASGQEPEGSSEQTSSSIEQVVPQVDVDADEIDEIIVAAPRSLTVIKRQIERADFELYDIANTLIEDPMYKVYCRRENLRGSNVKRRTCIAGYERELMSESWEDEKMMGRMGEGGYTFNYQLPEAELRKYRENMKALMIALAADHPQLAAAIYKRAQLQRDYETERKRQRQRDE